MQRREQHYHVEAGPHPRGHEDQRRQRELGIADPRLRVLSEADGALSVQADELLALDEALERLGERSERLRKVVELRFFGGLTEEETAEAMGVTSRTIQRDWAKARAWLHKELDSAGAGDSG